MKCLAFKLRATVCVAGLLIPTATFASGFDNLGIGSLDLLFDPARATVEFGYIYQDRNVDYQAENPEITADGVNYVPIATGDKKARATPNVWSYSVAAKIDIGDNFRCLARLNEPGSILEELPETWAGRYSTTRTQLDSTGLDATCAVRAELIDGGFFSLIGGGRYIDVSLQSKKMIFLGYPNNVPVDIKLAGDGLGWRVGAAFEYPEYAIRASLFYDSEVDINAKGTLELDNSGLPLDTATEITMPQGFEFRIQSGVAPKWLVFAGVKYVNWSVLDRIAVPSAIGTSSKILAFDDGWTVMAGVGHQLTEKIQVGGSVTWDQGIGGSYSDSYQFGLGGKYKVTDNITWSVGGAMVYKTGASGQKTSGTIDNPFLGGEIDTDRFNLKYDASLNFGIGTRLKFDF